MEITNLEQIELMVKRGTTATVYTNHPERARRHIEIIRMYVLVKRTGAGMQTKYTTTLAPAEELAEDDVKLIRSKKDYLLRKYL